MMSDDIEDVLRNNDYNHTEKSDRLWFKTIKDKVFYIDFRKTSKGFFYVIKDDEFMDNKKAKEETELIKMKYAIRGLQNRSLNTYI